MFVMFADFLYFLCLHISVELIYVVLVVLHFFANTHSRKPILISPWIYGHMLYTCILFDKIKYICVYLEDEATCSVYAMYFKTMTIYLI